MKLVREVKIEGFRSISAGTLNDVGSLTALVGRNSSGKSNVLRALNLFFNDEVDPRRPLSFARDAYDEVPRPRKKKRIQIEVGFTLPGDIRFRKGLEPLEALGKEFSIARTWELDVRRNLIANTTATVGGAPVANGSEIARQFLGLITFRYIPNRSVPAQIFKDESQAIAAAVTRRLGAGGSGKALIQSISEAGGRMLEDASASLVASGAPLGEPSLSTGDSLEEILRMIGFQARGRHGAIVQDEDWGSGHQSLFLYELLRAIDTTQLRSWGWKQGTIWAVEEPESAMHRDLEVFLADQLRRWTSDPKTRLQVLLSTHSPVMTMAANSGYWVEIEGKRTVIGLEAIPALTAKAEARGVSTWLHPALSYPWHAVVLVEGETDARILSHVARVGGIGGLRFVALPSLDPKARRGGKDRMITYLKENAAVIQNRPSRNPLIALFDWEVTPDELKKARKQYGPGADQRVVQMDQTLCEAEMGPSFSGIERFYPSAAALEAHASDEMVLGIKEGRPYSVSREELDRGKAPLMDRVLGRDKPQQLHALLRVVMAVDRIARGEGGVQLALPGMDDPDPTDQGHATRPAPVRPRSQ